MFKIQKSGDKTSSEEIGHDIRTHASPNLEQDQVSGGVSVLCRHATPVADAQLKPIISNVKFSKKSNQGKDHDLVVSNQGKESNSVRRQLRESVIYWWCNVRLCVSGLDKRAIAIPKWDRTRCPEE